MSLDTLSKLEVALGIKLIEDDENRRSSEDA